MSGLVLRTRGAVAFCAALCTASIVGCDTAPIEPGTDSGVAIDVARGSDAPSAAVDGGRDAPAPTGCVSDTDCDDGDPTTTNFCLDGTCVFESSSCTSDFECGDFDACTSDACVGGTCRYTPIADCAGCRSDAECDDGDASTFDVCDTFTRACSHFPTDPFCSAPADCDDRNPCTDDQCNGSSTCAWGSIPNCCFRASDCGDGNECTTDDCDLGTHTCTNAAIPGCSPGCPDRDGDGFGSEFCFPSGGDCDDANRMVHPGATELCTNLVDDDCDGRMDAIDSDCASTGTMCSGATTLAVPGMAHGTIVSEGFTATGCGGSLFYTISVTALTDLSIRMVLGDIVDPPCPFCPPGPGPRHEIWYDLLVERTCGDAASRIGAFVGGGGCYTWSPGGGFGGPRDRTLDLRRVPPGVYTIEVQARDFFPTGTPTAIPFDLTVSGRPSAAAVCDGASLVDGTPLTGTTMGSPDAFGLNCSSMPVAAPEVVHSFTLAERRRVRLLATPEFSGGSAPPVHLALLPSCDPDETPTACVDTRGSCETSASLERILDPGTHLLNVESSSGAMNYELSLTTEAVGAACTGASVISVSGASSGTNVGATDHFRWNGVCGGGAAGEVVYALEIAASSRVVLDLISSAPQALLRVVSGCGLTNVAGSDTRTRIDRTFEPGTYQVIVDGAAATDVASFVLNTTILPM